MKYLCGKCALVFPVFNSVPWHEGVWELEELPWHEGVWELEELLNAL
jgi:hypothetical protein